MNKLEKLNEMMNKSWKDDRDEVVKFFSYTKSGDEITIATDKEWIKTNFYELNVLFKKYTEVIVNETGVSVVKKKDDGFVPVKATIMASDTIKKLQDVLLDNIEKIKADKEYVAQAKEISNSVNSIIGLAKVEIELKTKL